LQSIGYRTAFYHGGNNGTMRFNTFSKRCGFDKYIGRNEYPQKDRDYDGNWGIWDEPFLQFFGQQLNVQKEPFCATIFTVSSHHPYSIPKQYEGKLPAGPLEIEQTVAYTDLALRSFFHSIASMPWYQNTLFIITADHTSISEDPKYASRVGTFSIPILYYYPGKKLRAAYYERVTQQIDILPSVLQFCNYKGPFTTFGKSVFESIPTNRFALTYLNRTYQLINDTVAVEFAAGEVKTVQRYKEATTLKNQVLLSKKAAEILTKQLLARKQLYSKTIIKNQLFPTKALD
jgi:uncharacterized sulfatase